MSYGNWGAFVFRDGTRRTDKEDVAVFATDASSLPADAREFADILTSHKIPDGNGSREQHHAVLGDEGLRLCGYKFMPSLWRFNDGAPEQIDMQQFQVSDPEGRKPVDGDDSSYKGSLDGYEFTADQYNDNMVDLWLKAPDGTEWSATCGYCYGAGHTDPD